jgi:hypothetical protein
MVVASSARQKTFIKQTKSLQRRERRMCARTGREQAQQGKAK